MLYPAHAATIRRFLKRQQTGQAILILALGFIILLLFVGIVTDVSLLYVRYAGLRRAVDSAAVAAAGQFRRDRDYLNMESAARQFLEFHGVPADEVYVDTCENIPPNWKTADPTSSERQIADSVCDGDRKLVRVTAKIESETVFMHLVDNFFPGSGLNFDTVTLEAAAVSETASLDVVIVLDVSESMLTETTYDTWDRHLFGAGTAADTGQRFSRWLPVRMSDAHTWYKQEGGSLGNYGYMTPFVRDFLDEYKSGEFLNTFFGGSAIPFNPSTDSQNINVELTPAEYYMSGNTPRVLDPGSPVLQDINGLPSTGVARPSNIVQMRSDCRVRIHPMASSIPDRNDSNFSDITTLTGQYIALTNGAPRTIDVSGSPVDVNQWNNGRYDFFRSNYDFYGCCNDPSAGATVDLNGNINISGADFSTRDWDFSDLVCQPFKDARDATRLFLQSIDFFRGDRVAFVTFDRGAYLIDPDGDSVFGGGDRPHMIDDLQLAIDVLNQIVGVRAEPNFYWTDHMASAPTDVATGFKVGGVDRWEAYSKGLTVQVTGDANGDGVTEPGEGWVNAVELRQRPRHSGDEYLDTEIGLITSGYQVRRACPFDNAAYPGFQSIWTDETSAGPLYDVMNPPVPSSTGWMDHYNTRGLPASYYGVFSYEWVGSCRGTNIGAALREANNALVDPQTTRQEGAVWVIVLLSDGAAGATDPVRVSDSQPIDTANPYLRNGSDTSDPANPPDPDAGRYGAYGFCPYGTSDAPRGIAARNIIPCTDLDPQTRYSCNTDLDSDPWKKDRDEEIEGVVAQALTGNSIGSDAECQARYDADDYARDWADYVARDRALLSGEQLPSIFTIGFNLDYETTPSGSQSWCEANPEQCLGEELLRYIADIGDNNEWNDDYPNSAVDGDDRGRDYGNYFNAPDESRLGEVFDEIAGKLFTRLAG